VDVNLGALRSRPGSTSISSILIALALSFSTCFSQFRVNISLANGVPTCLRGCNGCRGQIVRSFFGVWGVFVAAIPGLAHAS